MPNITIEVVYASLNKQSLLSLQVPQDSTVQQAISLSGLLSHYPEISLADKQVGIWSKPCNLDAPIKANDRIEIYRTLQNDAKKARIERVNNY
jgi:uncharacterized protein